LEAGAALRPLLDARAAGELLDVPASWILAQARADRIPHVRLGRYVRFEADELEAWLHFRTRGPVVRGTSDHQGGGELRGFEPSRRDV
jgi:excisionase family DNA binding protein